MDFKGEMLVMFSCSYIRNDEGEKCHNWFYPLFFILNRSLNYSRYESEAENNKSVSLLGAKIVSTI